MIEAQGTETGAFAENGQFEHSIDSLRSALNKALRGKQDVTELVLAGLLAQGHILIEDLPGLGKTTLAKALADAIDGQFARIQCTPDLLPSDITGFNIFNQKSREFEFQPGPVFADVLLADEINRATPRTQSALFEAMSERQVTLDRHCRRLPETFFVLATQNPVESHGAYPLPEAQLDRFAMKLSIGYPDRDSTLAMLADDTSTRNQQQGKSAIITPVELATLQRRVLRVIVSPKVMDYLADLAEATRTHQDVVLGMSPRGLLTWQRLSKATAYLRGRDFVIPEDVQHVARPVLSLRLSGDFESADSVIDQILESVDVPLLKSG